MAKDDNEGRLETIEGHLYLVVRDEEGNIIRQEGRDPATTLPNPIKIVAADKIAATVMISRAPSTLTLAEVGAMVQFLVKRELAR